MNEFDDLFNNVIKLTDNYIGDLKKLPSTIDSDFSCRCNKYETLENCPNTVRGNFDCSYNNLKTLKGSPYKTKWFIASHNLLQELDITTEEINGNFYCDYNPWLKKLNGNLKIIKGDVFFTGCTILSDEEIRIFMSNVTILGKVYNKDKHLIE